MSCQNEPKPTTFVSKPLTQFRRRYFFDDKFLAYLRAVGRHDNSFVFYREAHFRELLETLKEFDGVRIYLATYSNEGSPKVPPGHGGLMTFIYAPTMIDAETGKHFDTRDYFIMNPESNMESINQHIADTWVRNYQTPGGAGQRSKLEILSSISRVIPNDTKSILFKQAQIEEFLKELNCQQATGAKLYLTSYMDNDPVAATKLHRRTTVQFVFTENVQGVDTDFYIDDRPGFEDRRDPPAGSMNTGSPCPPDSCDGFSLPA